MTTSKYDPYADRWTEEAYADPDAYLAHRAELIVSLGTPLEAGDTVLDLACGDAGLAEPLLACGLRYVGIDLSAPMVEAARRRVGRRAEIEVSDLNTYTPPVPVAATTCFRAIYYTQDRAAFFSRVAGFTEKKLVLDLNPRQYRVADVVRELERAGFGSVALHPFFAPQRVGLPRALAAALRAAERSGPLARTLLRFRFSYLCAAVRD